MLKKQKKWVLMRPIEDEDYKEYYNQLEKQRNADLELIGEEEE